MPPKRTLPPLPPRRPALNPVEKLRRFRRDNRLSSRVFGSCGNILDHYGHAWNRLMAQPRRSMAAGFRDRAFRS